MPTKYQHYRAVNRRKHIPCVRLVVVMLMGVTMMLSACSDGQQKAAEQLLARADQLFEQQQYDRALIVIDSLRKAYPTAIDIRRQALRLQQDIELKRSQEELAVLDSTLQAVKRDYEKMKEKVDKDKDELQATAEELTALTKARVRRDSLQTRFDVLCAKIRYIHKKQKEL